MSLSSGSVLRFPRTLLAQAKELLARPQAGGTRAPDVANPPSSFLPSDGGSGLGMTRQDKSFWASVTAADGRLAELRRAIDEAAAEAIARESAAATPSNPEPHLGESRYETAARVITNALGTERS
jgi:hypothetical protein